MRICSPQLGLSPNATLGGEVHDREILTGLARLGVEVDVLLPAGQRVPAASTLRVRRLPLRRGYRWWVSNLIFTPYIGRAYRRHPFDLLRVHSLRFTGLAALWARKLYSLPVPIVAHHHHTDQDRLTRCVDFRVARAVDMVVTVSRFAADDLTARLEHGQPRIEPVYNGVADRYRPGPPSQWLLQRLGLGSLPALLYVGSLNKRKNVPLLLEAFRGVLAAREGAVRLLVVGSGPEEGVLRAMSRRMGLEESVVFCGAIGEGEKIEYYRVAKAFVTSSRLEGFGLAIAEAMGCGLPVVATRVGAVPEVVVDGETGLLVPPGDKVALAAALTRLLDDEELARGMGEAGRSRALRMFRWEDAAAQTLHLYEEAVAGWGA
jgi:glycosyltransferase involved in cell wall biosynthesis